LPSADPRQDRALAPDPQEPHLLENYYLPGDLEFQIAHFVDHYNHCHYHESLQNLTPADVYFGRGQTILLERERIKRDTIKQRGLQFRW
jgi:putative transposase